MNRIKTLYLIGLLLGVLFLIPLQGWAQPKPETKGHIITYTYAIENR
jgi:hypothetical protein